MFHITDSEYEVMEMVWKRQTLNTFLSRLEEKGLVEREKRIVKPLYSREQYHHLQLKETIDQVYNGRLSNLVLAFTRQEALDKEEAERLLRIIQQKGQEEK